MTDYVLPDLPYDYAELEPHYSGQILELHHDKHHAAYVGGANTTLERLAEAREKNDYASIGGLEKTLAFNISGHVLHSIFWKNLSPEGGDRPEDELALALDQDFKTFDAFRAQLTQATTTIQGSGWGVLAYEPLGKRLRVEQVYDHQGNLVNGSIPLLVSDAWEHAFYLQYKNVKADFVEALWNIVNWTDVGERLAAAKKLSISSADPPTQTSPRWRGSLDLLYCEAFGAPPWNEARRGAARFLERLDHKAGQVGFRLLLAVQEASGLPVGFAYGATSFGGNEPEPCYQAVVDAVGVDTVQTALIGAFEFVDLAVLPSAGALGIGGRLHDALLGGIVNDRAWLMTRLDAALARALYARRGWNELARFTIHVCDVERVVLVSTQK